MPKEYVLFLAMYAVFMLAALVKHPSWGIFLYVAIYFASPWTKWWGPLLPELRWVLLVEVVCLVACAIRWRQYANRPLLKPKPLLFLFIFSALMLSTGLNAAWPETHSVIIEKQLTIVVVMVLLYKSIQTPKQFEGLLWTYMAGVFYVGYVAYTTGRTGYGRLEGVGPIDSTDANDIAAIFVSAVPLLLFYALEAKKVVLRALAMLFLPFVLNGLILANSRGGILGTGVGVGLFLWALMFTTNRSLGFKIKIIGGAFAALGLFLYLADATFWDRLSTVTLENDGENEDFGRFELWKYGIRLALDNPFGVGGMGYTRLSPTFLPPELLGSGTMKAVHSTYVEALTAYGFLGLFAFLAFLATSFNGVRKTIRDADAEDKFRSLQGYALMGSYAGFLVSAIFIDRLYCEVTYYFPIFFLVYRSLYAKPQSAYASPPATYSVHGAST